MEHKVIQFRRKQIDQVLEASENNVARRRKLISLLEEMTADDRLVNQFLCDLITNPQRAA